MSLRLLHFSDVENAYDDPDRIGRLAHLLSARDGDDALLLGTGDNTGPGVLSLATDGRQSLALFDAVSPAVDTFGNHDFDHGIDALAGIAADSPQTWVNANVELDGRPLSDRLDAHPSTLVQADRTTVGVVGVVDPATPDMVPGTDMTVTDPVDAVAREHDRLKDRGADRVVALAHVADGERVARETGVDVVLAGHVHDAHHDDIDGTLLTRPGAHGDHVVEIDLDAGEVRRHDVSTAPIDESVADALRDRNHTEGLNETVATVDEPLYRGRDRRTSGEFRIGNFVADAIRWGGDAEIAVQNTGGIRSGPPFEGDVTVGEVVGLVPFEQPLVVATVTGEELTQLAREADGERYEVLPDYWQAQVSGMSISRDGDDYTVTVDGEPTDPDRTYRLATSAYVLSSNIEFPTLTEDHLVETHDIVYDVLVDYARETGFSPSLDGRLPSADDHPSDGE